MLWEKYERSSWETLKTRNLLGEKILQPISDFGSHLDGAREIALLLNSKEVYFCNKNLPSTEDISGTINYEHNH